MSDAQANPYYSANSTNASVNNEGGTDVEEVDKLEDVNVPPTIITRVTDKGTTPRRITWPVVATPSVQGQGASRTNPGPTTDEVLQVPDISNQNPIVPTNTKTRRKPPAPIRVVPTPASPPSIPHPSGSRAYAKQAELDAVFQSILSLEDNSEDDDLIDLTELRLKNKRRRRRQARKLRRLSDQMRDERRRHEEILHLKSAVATTAATSSKDRSDQKSYTTGRFDGNKSIGKLTEDLRVETLARSGWDIILNVQTATGKTLSLLEHSAIITEK